MRLSNLIMQSHSSNNYTCIIFLQSFYTWERMYHFLQCGKTWFNNWTISLNSKLSDHKFQAIERMVKYKYWDDRQVRFGKEEVREREIYREREREREI